jgi:hypothetical protein
MSDIPTFESSDTYTLPQWPPADYFSVFCPAPHEYDRLWQSQFLRHLGLALAVVGVAVVVQIASPNTDFREGIHPVVVGLVGGVLGLGIAAVVATAQLSGRPGVLRFRGNAFEYYSLNDLKHYPEREEPFPVSYASPARGPNGSLVVHYHDRVLTLKPEHWPQWPDIETRLLNPVG